MVFWTNTRPELKADLSLVKRVVRVTDVGPNAFASPRWRQSTTMANDVYRRHAYFYAGIAL